MYKCGDYNAQCDSCGFKFKASELKKQWNGLYVCSLCFDERHPQEFVKAPPDDQSVPWSRSDVVQSQGSTTVKTTALRDAMSVTITSGSGLSDGDPIGIVMDDGSTHWSYCNGAPAAGVVTLGSPLYGQTTSGNAVYKPSVNNESFTTGISATEL